MSARYRPVQGSERHPLASAAVSPAGGRRHLLSQAVTVAAALPLWTMVVAAQADSTAPDGSVLSHGFDAQIQMGFLLVVGASFLGGGSLMFLWLKQRSGGGG